MESLSHDSWLWSTVKAKSLELSSKLRPGVVLDALKWYQLKLSYNKEKSLLNKLKHENKQFQGLIQQVGLQWTCGPNSDRGKSPWAKNGTGIHKPAMMASQRTKNLTMLPTEKLIKSLWNKLLILNAQYGRWHGTPLMAGAALGNKVQTSK